MGMPEVTSLNSFFPNGDRSQWFFALRLAKSIPRVMQFQTAYNSQVVL